MLSGVRILTVAAALAAVFAAAALAVFGTAPTGETTSQQAMRLDHLASLWDAATWVASGCGLALLIGYAISARYPSIAAHALVRRSRRRPVMPD
jgi:uncharacterized membrane protein YphA (DoxX/SURF4 family)